MRVLFVGASGVIGRQVVPLLMPHFELVLAALEAGKVAGLAVHAVDICDFESTQALVRECHVDAVVNCAVADYREHQFNRSPEVVHRYRESTIDVNIRGAYHLYEAAARAGVAKFVFISSLTVISGSPHYEHVMGGEAARPGNFYACTKNFGEQMGALYAAEHSMNVTCLRLGHPYPLHDALEEKRLAHRFWQATMVHFEDIAQAITCALRKVAPFATYPIVSSCEEPWIVPESTHALGYVPRYFFTPQGADLRETGRQ